MEACHALHKLSEMLRTGVLDTTSPRRLRRSLILLAREVAAGDGDVLAERGGDPGTWTGYDENGDLLPGERLQLLCDPDSLERLGGAADAPQAETAASGDHALLLPLWSHAAPAPEDATSGRPLGVLRVWRAASTQSFTDEEVEALRATASLAAALLALVRALVGARVELAATRAELGDFFGNAATSDEAAGAFVSDDPAFSRNVLAPLLRASSARSIGILLMGPDGSGRRHLARQYHDICPRRDRPFLVLDCTALKSAEILSQELFGDERGRRSDLPGGGPEPAIPKAVLAAGGTLYVDEIANLPHEVQARLLRLLKHGSGSDVAAGGAGDPLDVQVLASTRHDLISMVHSGRFLEELYWRVSELSVTLPPLSQRRADIPRLARELLRRGERRSTQAQPVELTSDAVRALMTYDWSQHGNADGLEHVLSRSAAALPPGRSTLDVADLRFAEIFSYSPVSSHLPAPAEHLDTPTARLDRHGPALAVSASAAVRASLRELLEAKLRVFGGAIAVMASDRDVAKALGYTSGPMPKAHLWLRLRDLGLIDRLQELRAKRRTEEVTAAGAAPPAEAEPQAGSDPPAGEPE
ncbi:MAG: sigma-54-dependent Fis family transcriptional regulator [Candidatus Schekmanbacteria bacterium]|nr:sigma-54-dependent Fis family transcriptional regulator [Candidatus Schekmanbacteria bacterium]